MTETSIDRVISEERFAAVLAEEAAPLFQLANTLLGQPEPGKRRIHLYQLGIEADLVEAFLDDHGAKHNRAFVFLRELVASVRGFARVGFALEHLSSRFDGYDIRLEAGDRQECRESIDRARGFVLETIRALLEGCREEAQLLGMPWPQGLDHELRDLGAVVNLRLPHNLGDEPFDEDDLKVAGVSSKYLQVCEMFAQVGVRRVADPAEREAYLGRICTEERARVYEATVHNLQSAYDTYIKGTTLEGRDGRLPVLRGHASAAFHLLEAVTGLAHFVERHAEARAEADHDRMVNRVDRARVREITLNDCLYWAERVIRLGEPLAREVLASVSQVEEIELEVPEGLTIHARPASLIVHVVNRYEMPVELEIAGSTCNAASILEVLICAGSNPEARTCRFRGDARPLRDLRRLFEARLGEEGLDALPAELGYLAGDDA
jgi:phosphotransferase system HPr (HPr) family protein